jgi:hypothetical protein
MLTRPVANPVIAVSGRGAMKGHSMTAVRVNARTDQFATCVTSSRRREHFTRRRMPNRATSSSPPR